MFIHDYKIIISVNEDVCSCQAVAFRPMLKVWIEKAREKQLPGIGKKELEV